MKALDPTVKAATDLVYAVNPAKFRRLIVWIRQAEQQKFTAPVIAEALRRFLPYAADVDPWWPYLDTIIYKAEKDLNVAEHNRRHEERKRQEREAGKALLMLDLDAELIGHA